jgi:hypothetical protein
VFTYSSGSWTQSTKLVPSDSEASAFFGISVSLNAAGDVALVGAYWNDATGGADSGAAYVFTSSSGSWTQTTKLVPSDSEAGAYFGTSVSLNAAGDVALVGAYYDDANSAGSNSGAAYVFTSSSGSWTETTKLVPSDSEASAWFGISVSLNAAGDVALVGASWDDATGGSNSGAAYVFTSSSGSWTQTTKLVPSDSEAGAYFGTSVSLNAAGDVALVGAYWNDATGGADSGAAYVFTSSSGSWTETTKLVPSDSEASAYFGTSVSLNAAGDVALVGAYFDDANSAGSNSGAAYVFTSSSGSWTQTRKLVPSDSEAEAYFGISVSLNAAGDVALVGANWDDADSLTNSGAAYVFTYSSGSWTQSTKLVPSGSEAYAYFGYSVSLNAAGDVALVGAYWDDANSAGSNSGAAYVFTYSSGSWTQTTKLVPSDSELLAFFGYSVSLNAAGDVALVGAYNDDAAGGADNGRGAAYVFTSSSGSWTQTTKLVPSDSEAGAYFGASVSLNAAGDVALVGAYGASGDWALFPTLYNSGAAYVFTSSSGSWTQTTKLFPVYENPSVDRSGIQFGISVSLNAAGDVALVGASSEDAIGGADSGAAYVFTSSSGSWTQTRKLVPSDSEASAYFGASVSLNAAGNVALVGASWDDATGGADSGAAYVFTSSFGPWTDTKLVPSDSEASAYFGAYVSLNAAGDVALVGALLDDAIGGADSGAAYVFTSSSGSWTETTKLVPSDSEASAWFGISVSLNAAGDVALVGAAQDDANSLTSSGAAYAFRGI